MDAAAYASVIKIVCTKLGLDTADNTLIRNVTAYCKRLDLRRLVLLHETPDSFYQSIADSYLQTINPVPTDDAYAKQVQNAASTKEETPGMPLHWHSNRALHLYIDSRLRLATDKIGSSITDFVFSLVPRRQFRGELGDGQIQVPVSPAKITYLKLGKIVLPYTTALRTRNFSKELTLTFAALRGNGIIARDDTYHFAFVYHIINDFLVELRPVNEYCKFSTPINYIDDLSLRFNDPLFPVSFLPDRIQPANFNYLSSDGRIVFATPHTLVDGDIITIDGLRTNNNSENAPILQTINDPRGVLVTKVNNNVIATSIDFTTIISPDLNSRPTILVNSRMFRFPLEIGYDEE